MVAGVRYLESSVVLAALLEHDIAAMQSLRADGRRVTSSLTIAECARAIIRAGAAGRLTRDEQRAAARGLRGLERRCNVVAVNERVLARVGQPFPVEPIRTLDAVHLATVELLGEPPQFVTVVTRDGRIRENASALGYVVE
jgi:predicted nucleic acid-binding protein